MLPTYPPVGLLQWLARIVVDDLAPNQHLSTASNYQPPQPTHGSPAPPPRPPPPAAVAALETLVDLTRRRVCLRRQHGLAALLSYALALQHLAAATVAVDGGGGAALAAGACRLLAAVTAMLPPQAQPALWRCLPPRLLVGLREALGTLPAVAEGGGGGGSSVSGAAIEWLQVGLSSRLHQAQRLPASSRGCFPSCKLSCSAAAGSYVHVGKIALGI